MWQIEGTNGLTMGSASSSCRHFSEPVQVSGRLFFVLTPEIRVLRVEAGGVVHEIPAPPGPHRFFHYCRAQQVLGQPPTDLYEAYGLLLGDPPRTVITLRLYPTGGTETVVEEIADAS